MNYLDDFFLVGDTFEECKDAFIDSCDLLIKLGFSKHPDKSQFIPVQKIKELQWWHKRVDAVNDIYHPLAQLTIYSDACPNGWGPACEKHSTGGIWTKGE